MKACQFVVFWLEMPDLWLLQICYVPVTATGLLPSCVKHLTRPYYLLEWKCGKSRKLVCIGPHQQNKWTTRIFFQCLQSEMRELWTKWGLASHNWSMWIGNVLQKSPPATSASFSFHAVPFPLHELWSTHIPIFLQVISNLKFGLNSCHIREICERNQTVSPTTVHRV